MHCIMRVVDAAFQKLIKAEHKLIQRDYKKLLMAAFHLGTLVEVPDIVHACMLSWLTGTLEQDEPIINAISKLFQLYEMSDVEKGQQMFTYLRYGFNLVQVHQGVLKM